MHIIVVCVIILVVILIHNRLYRSQWSRNLTLDVKFETEEAYEGDTAQLLFSITNKKLLPLSWILAKIQLSSNLGITQLVEINGAESVKSVLFSMSVYQIIRRKVQILCNKRGYYRIRHINLSCTNLLFSETFYKDYECMAEITIFPKILENFKELTLIINQTNEHMMKNAIINPDPFEFRGIREYQPIDPLRSVNFYASAITQNLMVNMHAPTLSRQIEIILNLEYYVAYPEYELFEQSIRLAATIAEHYVGQNVNVALYSNGRDVRTGSSPYLLGGCTPAHLYSIYQALAGLGLSYKPDHISSYMASLHDPSIVYIIISAYNGEDFLAAVDGLIERGLSVTVVLPVKKGVTAAPGHNTIVWEAM